MRGCGKKNAALSPRPRLLLAGLIGALFLAAGCEHESDGYLPAPNVFQPLAQEKLPPNSSSKVSTAVYIDVNTLGQERAREVLAETPRYILQKNSLQEAEHLWFDIVVLGAAELKQGEITPYIYFPPDILSLLEDWKRTIKPIQDQGIKVLLSIKGGKDGVSVGSLVEITQETTSGAKTVLGVETEGFGRVCADITGYYNVDGFEFNDIDGASPSRSPYPTVGAKFWNGQELIDCNTDNQAMNETIVQDAWLDGSGRLLDMLSYFNVRMGAEASFQGDISDEVVKEHPIIVREVNFGKHITSNVPRLPFQDSMQLLSYTVNPYPETFGYAGDYTPGGPAPVYGTDGHREDTAPAEGSEEGASMRGTDGKPATSAPMRKYGPFTIDLLDVDEARLTAFSTRMGKYTSDPADPEAEARPYECMYGLIYYLNLQLHSADQTKWFGITAQQVFGSGVEFR